jgi:hypothetical protein
MCLLCVSCVSSCLRVFRSLESIEPEGIVTPTQLYNSLVAKPCTAHLPADFGGSHLSPGVYCIPSAATFSQNVVLDSHGKNGQAFVFKITGAFNSVATRSIAAINGASPSISYAVAGATTLGATSHLQGTVVAT